MLTNLLVEVFEALLAGEVQLAEMHLTMATALYEHDCLEREVQLLPRDVALRVSKVINALAMLGQEYDAEFNHHLDHSTVS